MKTHIIVDNRGFGERVARWLAVRIAYGIGGLILLVAIAQAYQP